MIVPVSPLATPSSMIAALMVGRYSDASVLTTWSAADDGEQPAVRPHVLSQQRPEHPATVAHRAVADPVRPHARGSPEKTRSIGMSVVVVPRLPLQLRA